MADLENIYPLMIRGENLSEAEKKQIADAYAAAGKDAVYEAAKKKKILPFAAKTLCECGTDVDFWSRISDDYRRRNESILHFLDKAYRALAEHDVKKMFVSENFGALLLSDGDISLFASGDVDNYADPAEKEKIYAAFASIGCTRKERYAGKHQIAAEFFPSEAENLPEKFYVSVDFYPLARLKLPCFVRADDFVGWDKLSAYPGTAIKLPPASALMYICLCHISLHSFSRAPDIRLYIDLVNLCKTDADYDRIAEWCRHDAACCRVATAATIANSLMKTDFPSEITELSKRKARVLKYVYDFQKNDLRYEPHGLSVLLIEANCDDKSFLRGLLSILFPNTDWMKQVYGSSGFAAHLKHIKGAIGA